MENSNNEITIGVTATINHIIQNTTLDFDLLDAYITHYSVNDSKTLYEWLVSQEYINSFTLSKRDIGRNLEKILKCALLNALSFSANVRQCTSNPYFFSIESFTSVTKFPMLIMRGLICSLKAFGIHVSVEKTDPTLIAEDKAFILELMCKGKSDKVPEKLKFLSDEAKKFKGSFNPYSTPKDKLALQENNHTETARFSGAEWFNNAVQDVTLIGCGGIGSNVAYSLSRVMGNATLNLYDPDIVEQFNLAGQDFNFYDIGKFKIDAVKEKCEAFNPLLECLCKHEHFRVNSYISKVVITGLDNMAGRMAVFNTWKGMVDNSSFKDDYLLIDGRLSAEKWQIFTIKGDDEKAIKEYEDKWLFPEDEAVHDVCSYKQTAYAAQMIASYITNLYINFCANMTKETDDPTRRDLPFMLEYDASLMLLRVKGVEE